MPDIVGLLKIQERDLRLQNLRKELERIPRDQDMARTRLAANEKAVEDARTQLKENEVAIKNVELDVGTRKETIARLKNQQFETRKNEEYQALGHEVTRYANEIDGLETQELELMERGDEFRQILEEAEAAYNVTKGGVDEEIAALQGRMDNFIKEVEGLEAERTELAAAIDEDLLDLYDRILKLRGAPVVVQISPERQCLGCHVRVTPATLSRAVAATELVNCENCSRILYPS